MDRPDYIAVTARIAGFRRGGRAWPATPTIVAVADFDEAQLEAIFTEPNLVVAPADEAPPAEADVDTPADADLIKDATHLAVTARTAGFRRGGRAWPATPTVVAVKDLSEAQLAAILSEPNLVVAPGNPEMASEQAGSQAPTRMERLLDALDLLTGETRRDEDWTKGGRPTVGALARVAGLDVVTAAERNEAWEVHAAR